MEYNGDIGILYLERAIAHAQEVWGGERLHQ